VSHRTSAKLRAVIHWLILSEKCYIKMSQNLNCYVVMKDGKGGNKKKHTGEMKLSQILAIKSGEGCVTWPA
jgi:hypothetical protein